jgi:predicted oxidoreductase (fatty acid repression mutant protein)
VRERKQRERKEREMDEFPLWADNTSGMGAVFWYIAVDTIRVGRDFRARRVRNRFDAQEQHEHCANTYTIVMRKLLSATFKS